MSTRDGNHYIAGSRAVSKGLPSLAAQAAAAITHPDTLSKEYDVIVIGAGYTGLVAARDLSEAGKNVLIVEGRDRIGGRAFTYDFLGHKIELGGTWVHPDQPHVWSEMSRYGLMSLAESTCFAEQGEVSINYNTKQGDPPFLVTDSYNEAMGRLVAAYFDIDGHGGRTIFPLPFNKMSNLEAVQRYDSLSVQNRLEQLVSFTEQELALLGTTLTAFGSLPASERSFLTTLHYYALAGYDFDRLMSMMGKYKLLDGQSALASKMLLDFTGHTVFNSRVQAVESELGKVTLLFDNGERVRGKHLVCTVPVNCLADIAFTPPLPRQFITAQHLNMGGKVIIHLDKQLPSWWGLAADPTPVDCLLTDKHSERNGTFVVGFPPTDSYYAGSTIVDNPQRFLQDAQQACLPSCWDTNPTDLIWHDWNHDEFSKGQWAAWGAGQFKDLKSLMDGAYSSKEITLASADWADGWTGFIDGAIAEGKRAASRALEILNK